jgi:predicted ribonuclease YlaK
MKILFLDTNIFLQCRDLRDLPWDQVVGSENLLLLISRPVQEEIDRLKHDRNSRRAKRARKASSFIREIILTKDTRLSIRESAPRVEISFPPPLIKQGGLPSILDLTRGDDQIIAEAFAFKNAYPDADVAILTHDTNPILTAERCGLPYVMIPDDWLLPPEPDVRDKKIEELERRLKELERACPQIEVVSQDSEGSDIDSLAISVLPYRMPTESELNMLVAEVQTKHPMVTELEEPGKQKGDVRAERA